MKIKSNNQMIIYFKNLKRINKSKLAYRDTGRILVGHLQFTTFEASVKSKRTDGYKTYYDEFYYHYDSSLCFHA